MLNFPDWPVGKDISTIDAQILSTLRKEVEELQEEKLAAEHILQTHSGQDVSEATKDDELTYHKTKHKVIRLEREILEIKLTILLNELRYAENKQKLKEKIRNIGKQLNLSRRHRRTYDYILNLFKHKS